MKIIDGFDGEYHFLSNFAASRFVCQFTVDDGTGFEYLPVPYEAPTLEHAYQASKTRNRQEIHDIMRAPTAGKSKRLGRKATMRKDWDRIKDNVMLELLTKKFEDPYLRDLLLRTGSAILVEGNTWHDNYWGDCHCENRDGLHPECRKDGKNMLGYLLMQLRDRIRRDKDADAQ